MEAQAGGKKTMMGKTGRASRALGQLWQVPVFLAGLAAFTLVAATAPLRQDSALREFEDDLQHLRRVLAGKQNMAQSVPLAESVLVRLGPNSRKAGLVHFLVGSVYLRLADESPPQQAAAIRQQAQDHLEQALTLGVADEDQPYLQFRLGRALYDHGDLERALELLVRSVDRGSDDPVKGYGLVVQCCLGLPQPNLDLALTANLKQLEMTENEDELSQGRLVRGELLVKKGKRQEALQELERIGPQAPRPLRLKARLLQIHCCQEEGQWARAIPWWKELLQDADLVPGGKRRILFSLGQAYYQAEPPDFKEARAAWQQAVSLGGEEGQAASLLLAELFLTGPDPDPTQGLGELTRALLDVKTAQGYHNPLVPLSRVQEIFENAWRRFQEKQDFRRAEQLAELYKKIAPRGLAEEKLAQNLLARARNLEARAAAMGIPVANAPGSQAASWHQEALALFLQAGTAFEKSANARPLDEQPPSLWGAGACFRKAAVHARVIDVLSRFVQINNSDQALAEAWLVLAEAFQARGQKDEARQALFSCIGIPNTPFAARARLQLAQEAREEGNLEQTEHILKQVVGSPPLDRAAHAESLYLLAELFFQRTNYDQALFYLKEAFRQYPNHPKAFQARDQTGYCYRQLAAEISKKLQSKVRRDNETYLNRSRHVWLEEGARTYQALADDLAKKASRGPLPPADQVLFRRAEFSAADLRYEMNEFQEAMRRFQILFDKYRGELEGILSCHRLCLCAWALTANPELRRSALETARAAVGKTLEDLARMDKNHQAFHGPLRWNREEWISQLGVAQKLIDQQLPPQANSVPSPANLQ